MNKINVLVYTLTNLQQVRSTLNHYGEFYLFIPDKRSCYDHYIHETPLSPLSEVLATHYSGFKVNDLRIILTGACGTTYDNPISH